MKQIVIGLSVCGVLLTAACSEDPGTTGGTSGSGGSGTSGANTGGKSGAAAGGMAGNTAAGTNTGGGGAGTAGTPPAGGGGAGGAAGGVGGGGAGGGACDSKTGKAIKFAEKVNDMIAGDVGADIPSGDTARTMELWAKFTSANSWTAEQSIIELGKPNGGDHVWGIDMSGRDGADGLFGPYSNCGCPGDHNGGGGIKFAAAVDVGWLHLSWGYAGAGGKTQFTVNGVELPNSTPANHALNITPGLILLGASQNFGNAGWDGVMDELRIWKVLRTPAEILANMKVKMKGTEAGLAVYYNFDEAAGTDVADITKTATRTLKNCAAGGGACPAANTAMATRVDSDIPGPFTCAP